MPSHRPKGAELVKLRAGVRRGDVVEVDLRGAVGREQQGPNHDAKAMCRPCVVVSNDILNVKLTTLIVVPFTTHEGRGPRADEIAIPAGDGGLDADSAAVPHQVRTIDRQERVVGFYGRLSPASLYEIESAVVVSVADLSDDEAL